MPSQTASPLCLLGPQRPQPGLSTALGDLPTGGGLVAITAGWQEREGELDDLREHVGRPVTDAALYARTEAAFASDRALFDAHRERQDTLQRMQRLYRVRLAHALDAARELISMQPVDTLLLKERRAAIGALRALDRQHIKRVDAVHAAFADRFAPTRHPSLAAAREQLKALIEPAAAVLVAGGHVTVLLNRMRLLGLAELLATRPVFAWSAGAMALTERVVLFHDTPPQGPGDAEVIDAGLGLVRGIVPLPHASQRLQLADRARVSLFARRFSPDSCLTLDSGAALHLDDGRAARTRGVRQLGARGTVAPFGADAEPPA